MKTLPEIFHAARRAGYEVTCNIFALQDRGVTLPSQLRTEHLHGTPGFGKASMAGMTVALALEVAALSEREQTLVAQVAALTAERDALQAQLDKVRAAFS